MGWKRSTENDKTRLITKEEIEHYGAVDVSEKQKKPQEFTIKTNIFHLFKYATRLDITLMVIGTVFAIFTGACLPILGFYFGGMTNIFINQAVNGLIPDKFAEKMTAATFANAVPTKIIFNQKVQPVEFANNSRTLYKVIYTLTEFFSANLTNDDLWRNDTFSSEQLTESEFSDILNKYLIIYMVIGTLIMISSFIQTVFWEYSSEHQVHTIRKIYFSQILRQDISWYDQNQEGNLPNKLSDDLERIREGTGHKFVMIIQYLSTFISGIAVGLYVNARMTGVTLLVGPFLIGLTAHGAKFASQHVAREQQKYAKAGAVAEETLSNIKTVNAYSGQAYETNRYYAALEEGRKFAMKRYNALTISMGLTFFIMYGAYGLGFWYGSALVEKGISSPGSVFTVFFSVVVGAFSIGNALPFLNIVAASVGVSSTVEEIISRKATIDPYSKAGRKPARIEGHIEFRDVHFSYPSRPTVKVLNGLTLDIQRGKTTAIVGSSGAGKSTIVSLIQRFYDPTGGQVLVDGIPLTELNVRWLRSQLGLVSQEPILFGVSIADNIAYGRDNVTHEEIVEAAKQANAHQFIMTLPEEYNTLVGDAGSQLSGGQKQRIAIARALVRDPTILLLDEATSALDANSEGIVQETLSNVMVGRTTVIVAHRLSTIKNADVIYVMQAGKLFESGTHDELMEKQSLYYSLVMSQMKAKEEQLSSNEESPSSSQMPSTENSEDEQDRPFTNKGIFDTVIEEDEIEDAVVSKNIEGSRAEAEESEIEYEYTETGERKTSSKILDKKVSKTTKIENGCEYEVIVIETTVEELYENNSNVNLQVEGTSDSMLKEKKEDEADTEGARRRSTFRRGSSLKKLTAAEKKKIPLSEPEPVEKDISIWQILLMQKPEWYWLLLGIIGSLGVGLVTPIFALFYGEIFHIFTLQGQALEDARKFWTIMFAGLSVFCGLVYSFQCKGMTESCEKLLLRARGEVFQNILRQPIGWFDLETSTPGILVNRLARNIPLIKAAAGLRTGQVLSAIATLVAAFAIAFSSGWKLSMGLIICVPIIIYVSYKQAVLLKKNQMRDALSMDLAGQIASEAVRHIRTVQSLGQEKLFTEIYSNHLIAPYNEAKKQATLYAVLYAIMQGVILYMYAIAFRYGGYLVQIHEMETSNIYRVFFALSLCATSVGQSFMYLQDWSKARHATRILSYLLSRQSEIDPSSPSGVRPDIKGTVEFRRVQFVYPTRPDIRVLRRLSFKIESGKTLALVGESGCGKSTVIALLERFYDPISGVIMIDGYDIRTINLNHLRSNIGIVNQEPILFDCSIKDNIAYGALAFQTNVTFEQIQNAAKLANIHEFIMSLPGRYDTEVGERGVQLSGGQKQRVAIARALIRDPKILLLDEATSALDSESEKIVQTALDRAKEGRTCIVVAHRLSTIQNADLICVVSKGEIVEKGTHVELLEVKGHYYELTQRQVL